jgi:hypothetical protein
VENDIFDCHAIEGIFLNPNITSSFIDAIMTKIPEVLPLRFLLGVALCPAATPDQLKNVWAKQKSDDFRINLAKNPSTPSDVLQEILETALTDENHHLHLLQEILSNPNVPREKFRLLLQKESSELKNGLWESLAKNPSLNEEEQVELARKKPGPEALFRNPSLSKKAFDHLWKSNLWMDNWFPTHLCDSEKLIQAASYAIANPEKDNKARLALADPRCPSEFVLAGRSIDDYFAWKNEAYEIDWSSVTADEDMPSALAGRTDFPGELAMAVAVRNIFEDPEDPYRKYDDSAKWALAASVFLDPLVAEELYRRGITKVLENPKTPVFILIDAIKDKNCESWDRRDALQNPQISALQISELLELCFSNQLKLTEKPDQPEQVQCGFYRLQQRLRKEGWYIEWTGAEQLGHAWVDKPFVHPEGPFQGIKIDDAKCLLCCIGDPSDLLQPPEDLLDEEIDQWFEEAYEKLQNDDIEGLAEIVGQSVVDKLFNASPEVWGENIFMFDPKGVENLKAVLPLFEACGCRHGEILEGRIRIEWDTI